MLVAGVHHCAVPWGRAGYQQDGFFSITPDPAGRTRMWSITGGAWTTTFLPLPSPP